MRHETHTPGPWTMQEGASSCFHKGNRYAITVAEGEEGAEYTIAEVWPTCDGSDRHDARLIAAAPQLLSMVTAFLCNQLTLHDDIRNKDLCERAIELLQTVEGTTKN